MREAPLHRAMPLVEEALAAISEDVGYVLAMLKLANSVQARQEAWRQRAEARLANRVEEVAFEAVSKTLSAQG